MSEAFDIDKLSEALQAVQQVLEDFDNRGLIIGGVAVSLLSRPRFTADIDAIVLLDIADVSRLIEQAALRHLQPRVSNPLDFVPADSCLATTLRTHSGPRRYRAWRASSVCGRNSAEWPILRREYGERKKDDGRRYRKHHAAALHGLSMEIQKIVAERNKIMGFVPDPTATPEKARAMMRALGICAEDNLFSGGIIAAREEEWPRMAVLFWDASGLAKRYTSALWEPPSVCRETIRRRAIFWKRAWRPPGRWAIRV